jgi:LPXTG-motif cell wall-anchored protein
MKKSVLVLSFFLLLLGGLNQAFSQEQPKPKKDTVNIDTDAKPTFYYAEDEKAGSGKSGTVTIVIIAGAVVVVAAGAYLFLRKKK